MTSKPARKRRNTPSPGPPGPLFEALEPRLLLSADPLGGALATDYLADKDPSEIDEPGVLEALLEALAPTHSSASTPRALPELPPPVDLEALAALSTAAQKPDAPGESDTDIASSSPSESPLVQSPEASQTGAAADLASDTEIRREIVFVDPRTPDYQSLLQELYTNTDNRAFEVVILDADRDGIVQISEALSQHPGVDAVHIVSHGTDGSVQLGDAWLTRESLGTYTEALSGWQGTLTNDADLLFYGCDLAASEDGRLLIQNLGTLTGADVAASDDRTGHSSLGGDWALEYQAGDVESAVAFSGQAWQGVLASFTVNTFADTVDANPGDGFAADSGGNTSLRAAIMEANALAGADSIGLGAGTYTLSVAGTGENAAASGDLDIASELTITGAGAAATFIDGGGIDRVFHIQPTGDVSMTGLTIQNGGNEVLGGGIRTAGGGGGAQLTLTEVVVRDNFASGEGAGIYNDGLLTLIDTAITGNDTPTGDGGGLLNTQAATLTGVTISGNTADSGAGIYNDNQGVTLSLTNVTISGNTAVSAGGAIYTAQDADLTNVTITKNSASSAGGIHLQGGQGDAILKNTILADNAGGNVSGTLTSVTNSISTDATSGLMAATPLANLKLDTNLLDNGGPTKTHALLTGSVAINAGTDAGAPVLDQRGTARVGTTDIGAYEFGGIAVQAPTLDLDANNSSGTGGNDYQFTFTEGDGATAIADSDTDLADVDSTTFTNVTLALSGLLNGNAEELQLDGTTFALATTVAGQNTGGGAYTVTVTTGVGTATVTIIKQGGGTFTEVETETLIEAIQYRHSDGDNPSDGDRLIEVTVNDGTIDSAAATTTINVNPVNDAPTGAAAITGTVQEDSTLTADTSGISDADGLGAFSYQWQRSNDGGTTWNNVGADASTYTLGDADVGALMRVQVSYTDANSTAEGPLISAATAAVTNVNDIPAGTPAITGTVQEDQTLTADTSGITDDDGLGAFSYQWQRSTDGGTTWANVGADAATYVLGDADVGALLRVQVSYTDGHTTSEGPLTSLATAAVANVNDLPIGTPAITGTVQEDSTLTADTSGITDNDGLGSFSYQWQRSTDGGTTWNNVGVDASTYALGDSDVGALMRVQVSYTDAHSTAEGPLSSAATAAVTNVNDIPAGTPAITGFVAEDQTLTADTSGITDADGLGSFSYQWQRSTNGGSTWNDVGVDTSTYTLGDADVGALMRVQVSYTDGHSTAEGPLISLATAAVANINDVPVGSPTITGTVQEDQTLTADTSGITDDDGLGAFSYQWQRSTDGGTTWNNVGVDAATYVLGDADVGALMRVQVSYTDAHSTAEGPLTSAATAAVANINDVPVGTPSISGTVQEDQTLTANTGGITDDDGLGAFNYQWQRSTDGGSTWNNVSANADTYTLGDADVGALMRVQVAYTDGQGTAEGPLTSAATVAVVNKPASGIANSVPGAQTTNEDTPLIFSAGESNPIAVSDGSTGDGILRVSLSATNGTLTLATTTGLTFESGVDGSAAMTITASESAINMALNGLEFMPDPDYSGPANLQITTEHSAGLQGQYTFDNPGDVGNDDSPAGTNDGLVNGATPSVDGMRGKVLTFDGNDHLHIPGMFGNPSDVTLSAWVNLDSGITRRDVISLGDNVAIRLDEISAGVQGFFFDGGSWRHTNSGTNINGTGWHHVAYTVNDANDKQRLYIDGVEVATTTHSTPISYTKGSDTYLGRNGNGTSNYLKGSLDDALIYDRALTPDEISALFQQDTSDTDNIAITVDPVNDTPLGTPAITGSVQEDSTLMADTAAIADADGLGPFTYQWLRNGSAIGGATAASYTLGDADVGALMSVQVRYTDDQGTVETLTSTQTAAVANVNDAPVLGNNRLAITDGGTVVLTATELSATDVDHPNATLLFSVTNLSGGQFELISNPGVAVTGFTQAQVTSGQVHFVHDDNGAAPAYEVSVSDGGLVDGPEAAVVSFGNLNNTDNNVEPPPPNVEPPPDVEPPPKAEPPPDVKPPPEPVDEDDGDAPPVDETETTTSVEGVPGGSVTVVDEERLLPPVETDGPLTPDADNDPGTASPGSQGAFQTVMNAIATRPAALQALLGGVATAYGFSWGDLAALESDEYRQQLDRLRDDVAGDIFVDQTLVGSSIAVSTGLSVGYVLWLVRGGVLLSSVLSSLPAWRLIDPLPVLAYVKNRPEDDPDDGESLESLIKEKQETDDESEDDTDIERDETR